MTDQSNHHTTQTASGNYIAQAVSGGFAIVKVIVQRPGGLVAAVLIVLVVLVAGLLITGNLDRINQQLQVWGLTRAFPPEGKGETLIVIANFHHSTGIADTEAHNKIKRSIEKASSELGLTSLRVRVEPTHLPADDRSGAEALGKRYNASIMIWGEDTGVDVTVNFLNRKQPDSEAAQVKISETEYTQLANPSTYAKFVTEDLPGQLTFLSLFAVGQSYYNDKAYADSVRVIEKAVHSLLLGTVPPEGLADAYFRLGYLYQESMHNYGQAIASYEKALELNPHLVKAYYNQGAARYTLGDLAGAIAQYQAALQLSPDDPETHYLLGAAYIQNGQAAQAQSEFQAAIKSKPDMAIAYTGLGNAQLIQNDLAGAVSSLTKATKLAPNQPEAFYALGRVLMQGGDRAGARQAFQQFLSLNPPANRRADVEEWLKQLEP